MIRHLTRAVVITLLLFAAAPALAADKPNVVLIFADDLGYGDLGCYGATKVRTPNIDKLAKEGRRFTDMHSASAVCTPSRYALVTGRYPFREKNLWGPVMLRSPLVIDPDRLTIGDVMHDAGYATACIGKWHLGFGNKILTDWNAPLKPGPLELGFDYYFGVPVVNSHPPFVYVENHGVVGYVKEDPFVYDQQSVTKPYQEKMGLDWIGGAKAAHEAYNDEAVGTTLKEKAVAWLKQQASADKPFFLYLATTNIHHPFTPAKQFQGTSDCGRYGDFIHELDWIVGEVMTALREAKVDDHTLVIFTSDNGGMFNQGGQDAWKLGHHNNGELLGFKFSVWEGGHRVPMIARWPGKIPAGTTSNQLMCNVDFLATMAALVKRPLKEDQAEDSYNMLPALVGEPRENIRKELVICPSSRNHVGLREGEWMYISAKGNGGFRGTKPGEHTFAGPAATTVTGFVNSDIENGKIKADAPPAQLYNLKDDLKEEVNRYSSDTKVMEQMKERLKTIRASKRSAPLAE